jgi:hypothetical protein
MAKFLKYGLPALILIGIIFYFSCKSLFFTGKENNYASEAEKNAVRKEEKNKEKDKNENNLETTFGTDIPEKIFISVPFTSQAPFKDWDEFHEEACEEASLIMLKYYLDDEELNAETAEKEIQNLIKFQIKNYGDYKDTNAEETVKLAKDYYEIKNLKVVYDFSEKDLKKYLARNKPVIVPAAGRLLGNPYFTAPGPLYHNLVLVGYSGDKIITNDPGTKRGESYEYEIDVLYNAIHDFFGTPEDIKSGRKSMIVLE